MQTDATTHRQTGATIPALSDARTYYHTPDWPSGRSQVDCEFIVEHAPRYGERVTRRTRNPKTGAWCKPKASNYGAAACIATADIDGEQRTVVLVSFHATRQILVLSHDMKHSVVYLSPGAIGADAFDAAVEFVETRRDNRP